MLFLFLFALLAGFVTVLSPCILPVLPAILSAGSTGGRKRPLGVILGLLCSFIFFTLALTTLVQSFGLSANILRYLAICVIGIFGAILIFPKLSSRFAEWTSSIAELGEKLQSHSRTQKHSGFISGFIIGAALGLVWTPCAGPILAAITTLVATQHISFQIILLTIGYSLGAGIPLLAIAYGGHRALTTVPLLTRHSKGIRQIFGILMIITALALVFNWDVAFQQKILDFLPWFQVENNSLVKEELERIRAAASRPLTPEEQALKNAANTPEQVANLPLIAPAPQLVGITTWINSPPLSMQELKGKVVLIDFWTYSCINCIRTLPYLRHWYESYKGKGFVIIGVHTPEFEFEKNVTNVKNAVNRFHITYPVAMDNHYKTWQAYANSYWPAHYLIDQNGIVRQVHYGEGAYLETENAIRALLGLSALSETHIPETPTASASMTPETYLGYLRATAYASGIEIVRDKENYYDYTEKLEPNKIDLRGSWKVGPDKITSEGEDAELSINFNANRVYLVMGGTSSWPIKVLLDGQPIPPRERTEDMDDFGSIQVKEPRKYDVINLKGEGGEHILTLQIPKGIDAYAFTFGMEE